MDVTKTVATSIMLLLVCGSSISLAQEPLVRVAGDPYPPWTEGEQGAKATGGIAVGIVEELFNRLNMDTRVVVYPFKRGLERIRHGEEDVILMVSKSKDREQYMSFTLPIRHVQHGFFYSAKLDNFDWNEWKDLQQYTIGNISGYNLGEGWKEAVTKYNLDVEEVKADIFNANKLLLGRIDAFIADKEVMERFIEENPKYQGKFKWHQKPVFESINNFGISKKSFLASKLPEINAVIMDMKSDGTFQNIFCGHEKEFNGRCKQN